MIDAVDQREPKNAAPEDQSHSSDQRIEQLSQFWSVWLPNRVDPWSPQLADALSDGAWTAAWPAVTAFAPLLALVLGGLAPSSWAGIEYIYTESLLFMALIIAGAILSGPIGVMLFLGYVVVDFFSGKAPQEPFFLGQSGALSRSGGGQLISYLLLVIPALRTPLLARRMVEGLMLRLPRSITEAVSIRAGLYATTCALFSFLWCQAMIVLIRPVFTWYGGTPTIQAIEPVQNRWGWLVVIAIMAATTRIVLEEVIVRRSARAHIIEELQRQRWASPERRSAQWRRLPIIARVGVTAVMTTLILAGTYTNWLDALLVLAVTIALGAWRTGLIKAMVPWERRIGHVPALVRFTAAPLIGYLLANQALDLAWFNGAETLRPVFLSALFTLVVYYLLFPSPTSSFKGGPTA
jgi:hypothetical protein